jgi:hypothetical protein
MASPLLRPSFGDALNSGFRSALPMLGVIVLLLIGYFAFAIVFSIVAAILSFAGEIGAGIAVLLFVPALLYLACRLSILVPVVAVDQTRNPITAIGRSWQLTGGNVLKIFLCMLVFIAFFLVLYGVVFGMFWGSLSQLAVTDPTQVVGSFAMFFVVIFIAMIFSAIVSSAFMSVLHSALSDTAGEKLEDTFG